jgi:Uma2 family endonuclease
VFARGEETLLRVPMSWEQYLLLPDKPKAEWVDGVAVIMNAPPGFAHGHGTVRLAARLLAALPDHRIATEAMLKLPRNRVRLPDLMVVAEAPEGDMVIEPPLMVVEVLSRSTRSEDMIRKSVEYREAGIGQYWLLDPQLRTLEVLTNVDDVWETALWLDEDHPEGSVEVAGAAVPLDLRELLLD